MGATLRGRDATRPDPAGSCRLIQIGDLNNAGTFSNEDFTRIEPNETVNPSLYLRPGDLLFPNRGTRTTAAVLTHTAENILAGAQFFVVTRKSTDVLPEYLAWTLRTTEAARYFASRRKGTLVQTLQRFHLEEFPVPLPSLAVQGKILELADLERETRLLETRLAALRATHLEQSLLSAARQA
jgi:restriction endonuclease S subunit